MNISLEKVFDLLALVAKYGKPVAKKVEAGESVARILITNFGEVHHAIKEFATVVKGETADEKTVEAVATKIFAPQKMTDEHERRWMDLASRQSDM